MKKIILLAAFLFAGLTQAQVIEVTGNGEPIENGDTFTFNTLTPQATSELKLVVTNTSNDPINLKLRMNSIDNNSDGEQVQFCFGGLCFFTVNEGSMVPSNPPSGLTLQPGANNGDGDHFWNFGEGDVAGPVSYQMSFVSVDDSGAVLETLLTFNYVYQPTMSVNDIASLTKMGIAVNNTVVKDLITLNADQPATMEIYGLNGKLLKTVTVAEGQQAIDLSALSPAVYIAKFTTAENKSSSIRIVKQ